MPKRTPIGGLLLEAVEGWRFSVREGTIAGRRGNDPGLLRLTTRPTNVLPKPITHEWCIQVAARFARVYEPALHSQQTIANVTGPFGWGGGRWGKDYVCAWYCNRPPGLIIGVYAFPAGQLDKLAQNRALDEAAHIVASAVFNRPSWGGTDEPLTRYLIDQLEADWLRHAYDDSSVAGRRGGRGAAPESHLH
jgi:hypothetical protein